MNWESPSWTSRNPESHSPTSYPMIFLHVRRISTGWCFGTMELYDVPFSWECHHPNWLIVFSRGVGEKPPTSDGHPSHDGNPHGHMTSCGLMAILQYGYILHSLVVNPHVSRWNRHVPPVFHASNPSLPGARARSTESKTTRSLAPGALKLSGSMMIWTMQIWTFYCDLPSGKLT